MAEIKSTCTWKPQYKVWPCSCGQHVRIPREFLVVKNDEFHLDDITKQLEKLNRSQVEKRDKLVEKNGFINDDDWLKNLDLHIDIWYQKRTIKQNATMWLLYQIEADTLNADQGGSKLHEISKDMLYDEDMKDDNYKILETATTKRSSLAYYLSEYSFIECINYKGQEYSVHDFQAMEVPGEERIQIKYIRSSSHMTTVELAGVIDRLINRIAMHGNISEKNQLKLKKIWKEWRVYLNDKQIILHDTIMTQAEYKALNPLCEGCSDFVVGKAHLAHIVAVGMGGNRKDEPHRNYTSNWLCLCRACHEDVWHKKGQESFILINRHLASEVNLALGRDYDFTNQELFYNKEG